MWFLYGELFVLMLVSFVVGSLVASVVMRAVVRNTADQVSARAATETPTAPGATS